jgi:hypothetical protein
MFVHVKELIMSDRTPKPSAPGQLKNHTITRSNPETGEQESREITQQEWKDNGQALRADGWSRPEDAEPDPEAPGDPDQ